MNASMDQNIAARNRLIQLLDYVSHQAEDTQKIQYEMSGGCLYSFDIQALYGVKLLEEGDWWFEIERLKPLAIPRLDTDLQTYISVDKDQPPSLNFEPLQQILRFQRVSYPRLPWHNSMVMLPKLTEQLRTIFAAFTRYTRVWEKWYHDNIEIVKSIKVYDQIFSWNTAISLGGSSDGEEIVAGFGLINWLLPNSAKSYVYPLMTIPLEMEIEPNGLIRVGAKDTRANLEMDAILQEDELTTSGKLKVALKQQLNDGRELDLFESDSYSDIAQAFVANISSTGMLASVDDKIKPSKDLVLNLAAVLFSRPRKNSILNDDIEALKIQLSAMDADLPEQPLSLVTGLDQSVKEKTSYTFRGRAGVDGAGAQMEELYFPLAYNKEQITIVNNLLTSSGVVVQGPPGTGKTHTIANIICHYLANGKKVLVTAQQSHVLKTVHEKIPDELKPLVISRIGSSKDSKNQLESSIDHIVQEVSQMNVAEVRDSIAALQQQIETTHQDMGLVDREIYNFAQKHYQNIEVDGNKKLPMEIANTVLEDRKVYAWFKDQLTLAEKDRFPFSNVELMQLRDTRKRIGAELSYLHYAELPDPERLIDAANLKHLCECLQEKKAIQHGLDANTQHLFKDETDVSEVQTQNNISQNSISQNSSQQNSTSQTNRFKQWLSEYVDQLDTIFAETDQWALGFLEKINAEDKTLELEIYTQLIQEVQPLLEYRKKLLTEPVELPIEIVGNSKEYEAIQRATESGKPFTWYHFGTQDLQNTFKRFKVSGKYPDTIEEWKTLKQYVDHKNVLNVFISKWNSIAAQLAIPLIESTDRNLNAILKEFTDFITKTQQCLSFKTTYFDQFNLYYTTIFKRSKTFAFYADTQNIHELIQLIDQKAKLDHLKVYAQQLQQQSLYLQQFEPALTAQLQAIIQSVHQQQRIDEQQLVAYTEQHKLFARLKTYKNDFEQLRVAAQRLQSTNAIHLSRDLLNVTYLIDQHLEDPVLKNHLVEVWQWKRLESYVTSISNTQQIEHLYERRKIYEKNLSTFYSQLAANKTWLALKENASDQILVALQRYKIAVQKIGKGTGKNAPRYRKDAQQALKEAAEAIPCWIMSHLQVSESMPAELGLFDLVIVDEASQSSIDVLPVLMRAKKLLVVGDNKQVSPSNVGLASAQIDVLRHKYLHGQPHAAYLTPDMSLYDMASSIYESSVMLLEHFRCHPAIIRYSNQNFYDNRIKPMRLSKKSEQLSPALVSIYTPQGYRESKNNKHINRIEAQAIIAEIKLLLNDPKYANRSIGVISLLGAAQAEFIQAQALDVFGAAALTQVQFACGEASSFQGAERDIIFLSMVADPHNSFALSRLEHEQRFNVAASRARERMYLVHSVHRDDISAKDLRLNLLNHFYDLYESPQMSYEQKLALCESEFEKSVFNTLHELGYQVTPQVKVGSYRIDLVVESDGDQRLAVECDGDSYHGPEQWHSDMVRQRALERAGWTFWRCFASSWEIERYNMLLSLQEKLKALGIKPIQAITTPMLDVQHKVWKLEDEDVGQATEAQVAEIQVSDTQTDRTQTDHAQACDAQSAESQADQSQADQSQISKGQAEQLQPIDPDLNASDETVSTLSNNNNRETSQSSKDQQQAM